MTEHLHNQETVSAALKRATKAFSGLKVINVINKSNKSNKPD